MTETRLRYIIYVLISGVLVFVLYRNLKSFPAAAPRPPTILTSPISSPMYRAVAAGDVSRVKQLLAEGAAIEGDREHDPSPLEFASMQKRREVMKVLLDRGANPNRFTFYSPLYDAIQWMPDMVPELLRHGADVNNPRYAQRGLNCLSAALAKPNIPLAKFLLAHGAKVNPPPYPAHVAPEWMTASHTSFRAPYMPLAVAAWKAPELESTLLQRGAKLGIDRETILISAATAGRADLIPHFLKLGANVNGISGEDTSLVQAILHSPTAVAFLLEHGAKPNDGARAGRTPLIEAAIKGNEECVRLLLAHGADANLHSAQGHSPLWFARKHNNAHVVELLEAAGGRDE